jgi:uncharacterized membrane protein YidH (DUF202 family)
MLDEGEMSLFDRGLQPERTDLAWRRTAIAFFVNAALVARLAGHTRADAAVYALAAGLALVGWITLDHTRWLYSTRAADLVGRLPAARPGALRMLQLATASAAVASLALTLTSLW